MPLTGGNEILANQNTAGNQQSSRITVLENGNIVLTWSEYDPAGSDGNLSSVKARVFTPQGFALTNEFQLNTETDGYQGAAQVAALAGGGFAVSWTSPPGGENNYSVRVFNDLGVPASAETTVNADTVDGRQSSIAALDDGGFVVTFIRNTFDPATFQNTGSDTVAQIFNADGSPRGGNVVLSSENGLDYNEVFAGVSGLPGGGYVAVWSHMADSLSPTNYLAARIVGPSGTPVGPEIVIATDTASFTWMDVTTLANGNFVVTWDGADISARVFTPAGDPVGDAFVVNQTPDGAQLFSRVTATADGGFTIAWNDNGFYANGIYNSATDQYGVSVMARSFDALGNPATGEFRVNIASFGDQDLVDIVALPTGGFAATWTDFQELGQFGGPYDTSIGDIRLRIYADGPNLAPVLGTPLELTAAEGQDFTVTTAQLLSRITDANPGDTLTISNVAFGGIPILPNGDGTYTITGYFPVDDPVSEQFALTYSVSDGTSTISAFVNVTVTADPAPVITTLGGGDSAMVDVLAGNTLVVNAAATDASQIYDERHWSISGGNDASLFTIDSTTGELRFIDPPAVGGVISSYDVSITVEDNYGSSDTQDITVRVLPGNDVPDNSTTTVNLAPGSAIDVDIDFYGDHDWYRVELVAGQTYTFATGDSSTGGSGANTALSLRDAAGDTLEFSNNNGDGGYASLTFTAAETGTYYIDAGTQDGAQGSFSLTLSGPGGGDEAVTLTEDERYTQQFDVLANDPAGAVLTTISQISFSSNSARLAGLQYFEIGDVSIVDNKIQIYAGYGNLLDRLAPGETATFTIQYQTDQGTNSTLTVTYTGVDDAVQLQFLPHETAENNVVAGLVRVFDPDSDIAGVSYSLSGTDAAQFTLDPVTGVLRFNAPTDFENPLDDGGNNSYDLTIDAANGAQSNGSINTTVVVTNVNEDPGLVLTSGDIELTSGVNTNSSIYAAQNARPSITTLENGGFATVYTSAPGYTGGEHPVASLNLQLLDTTGAPQGAAISLFPGVNPIDVSVAGLDNGTILVVAIAQDTNDVTWQRFTAEGAAIGTPQTIDRGPIFGANAVNQSSNLAAPSIGALPGGGFVLAWGDDNTDGVGGSDARVQIFDANGMQQGADIVLDAGAGVREDSPDIAVLADGTFVAVWAELKLNGAGDALDSGALWSQHFSAAGDALSPPALLDSQTITASSPTVIALSDGGFAVSWTDNSTSSIFSDYGTQMIQRFGADGAADGSAVVLSPVGSNSASTSLTTLPDGNILATWTSFEGDGVNSVYPATGASAQVFDLALNPVGDAFPLNVGQVGSQNYSETAVNSAGVVVGIWNSVFDQIGVFDLPAEYSVRIATYQMTGPLNQAPLVSGTVTLPAIVEDSAAIIITSAQLLANASDADAGDTLAVANLSASSGTLVSNGNGTWTFTPAANDDSAVTFSYDVSDGTVAVATSATLDLTPVNDGPTVISDQGNLTTAEDASFTLDVSGNFADVEGDTLTYSASGLPSWLAIDSATGVLSGTPGNDDVGTYNISVSASDGQAMISDAFTLTVTNVNDAPVVSVAAADQTAAEDAAFSYTLPAGTFTDVDAGDTLVLAASGLPGWLSFNAATRTFSGTPENGDVGTVAVTITATDSSGASVSDVFTLTVTNTNDAPIVTAPVTLPSVAEDSSVTVTTAQLLANSRDPDAGDALAVVSLSASSGTLVSNGDGTWTFTPAANDDTAVTFSYGVSDGTVTVATSVTLDLTPVNDAPIVVTPLVNRASPEDTALSFTLPAGSFSDVDNAALTLSATLANGAPLPGWLSFNAATRTFSGTPPLNFDGDLGIRVTATDAAGLSASSTFTLDITPLNDAPTDIALSGVTVAENSANGTTVGTATATDPDTADTRSFALTNNAGGRFAINASTGVISVANGALLNFEAATAHSIMVQVTDSGGASYSEAFTITVANVNEAPTSLTLASGGTVAENAANGTAVAQLSASDPDAGSVLSYSLSNNAGGRFAINAATGAITVANGSLLDFETATSHAITAVVTDAGGLSRTLNLTIGITDVVETTPSINGTNGSDILFGTAGNDVINGLDGNDLIIAGGGADIVFGGAGRDILYGDAGDDQIIGGAGADILLGGSGRDVFRYASVSDAPRATGFFAALDRETILDFNPNNGPNHDIIDLSAIDANGALAGDPAFAFIGANAFSGQAGQLRYAGGIVSADVNGDRVADLEIALFVPQSAIDASDFIL